MKELKIKKKINYIYLAGSIDKFKVSEVTRWRKEITNMFQNISCNIEILDPTVEYHDLPADKILDIGKLSVKKQKEIFKKDLKMLSSANFIVACIFENSTNIGTVFELGFAYSWNIPVIAYIENTTLRNHIFITSSACVVNSYDEVKIELIKKINKTEVI
ncbi:MAG: nucleoside 2-deoxyribosyltransferase [bacterium]